MYITNFNTLSIPSAYIEVIHYRLWLIAWISICTYHISCAYTIWSLAHCSRFGFARSFALFLWRANARYVCGCDSWKPANGCLNIYVCVQWIVGHFWRIYTWWMQIRARRPWPCTKCLCTICAAHRIHTHMVRLSARIYARLAGYGYVCHIIYVCISSESTKTPRAMQALDREKHWRARFIATYMTRYIYMIYDVQKL